MARPCSVCAHPRLRDINAALIAGEAQRTIADRFSIAKTNLVRHRPHIQAAVHAAEQERVLDVTGHVQAVAGVGVRLLASGDARLQLQAGGLILRLCEFVHQLESERTLADILARLDSLEQARTTTQPRTDRWPHVA